MGNMSEPSTFQSAIAAKRQQVADLRRQLELNEAELRGMELVASLLSGSRGTVGQSASSQPHMRTRGDSNSLGRLTPKWRAIMRIVRNVPDGKFTLNEVELATHQSGATMTKNAVRSQMYNYVQAGLLQRLDPGLFKFTDRMLALVNEPDSETASAEKEDAA